MQILKVQKILILAFSMNCVNTVASINVLIDVLNCGVVEGCKTSVGCYNDPSFNQTKSIV